MNSIWQNDIKKPQFEDLNGDIKTDVLIIGGGMAGLLCGYELKNRGVDCVIVEAREICGGITKNTTAKVTAHHGAIFDKMLNRFGLEKTALYFKAQQNAAEKIRRLCEDNDCDFGNQTSFVYSKNNKPKIEKEVLALNKIGCHAKFKDNLALPFNIAGAVCVENQGQFHPLKFAYKIAAELKIYENTEVLDITPDGAVTKNGKIRAGKIIVATHFPLLNRHGFYFLKMYQHRSYVLGLQNAPNVNGIYVDENDKGLSFRNYGDTLLLGGGGHRTGKNGGGWRELREFAAKNYKNAREVCHFATQDCKTLDDIAYIGQYSKNTPWLYAATGFNKWGMTNSMVAAQILADLITDKPNEFAKVFSPSRSILRPQLMINVGETAVNMLTPTAPRCSHLGCALKYNKQEHSWDCSCHGSRFASDGRVIDNPAKRDKSI